MLLDRMVAGVFAIVPTPFHPDGRIDEASINQLVGFYRDAGCDGIIVLGMMSEAPGLDAGDTLDVASWFIRRAGSIWIIVGLSAPGFAGMRSLARSVMELGADGAMTGYAFPDMLVDMARLQKAARRDEAHDLVDAHLPLVGYEQRHGLGLAARKYVMMRRGVVASDAQRKRAPRSAPRHGPRSIPSRTHCPVRPARDPSGCLIAGTRTARHTTKEALAKSVASGGTKHDIPNDRQDGGGIRHSNHGARHFVGGQGRHLQP